MTNKINVESSENVKVEINDNGAFIELNPLDVDFPLKMEKASKRMTELEHKLEQEILIIDKRQDVKDGLMSKNTRDRLLKFKEYNIECGKVVDSLFGEGTTKSIFGNKNYIGMHVDLFNSLLPTIKEVYGNPDAIMNRIKTKYAKEDSDVLK